MDEKVLNNTGLIILAMKQLNISYDSKNFQEYYEYGMEGLIRAVQTYDETKWVAESTYLTTCIKNEIIKCFKIKTRKKRYNIYGEVSLDNEYADGVNLYEVIPNEIDIEKEVIRKIRYEEVVKLMYKMKNKKSIEVLKMYYGIGCKEMSLNEIAKKMGVSHTRVSALKKLGLMKLKKMVEKEDI